MKKSENEKYVKAGITAVAVIGVGLLLNYFLLRLNEIMSAFQNILNILAPFLYGAVIAYILAPLCNRLESRLRRLMPKSKRAPAALAIVIAVLLALVVVCALIGLVLPQVWESIVGLAAALPGQVESAIDWFHDLLKNEPDLQAWWDTFTGEVINKAQKWIETDLLPTAQNVLNGLSIQVVSFVSVLKNLFLGVLISIYFLASRKLFARQAELLLRGIFPRRWADAIQEEVHYADRMFNGFLMGKLLDSAIIGVICFVVTTILRFDAAILISVIVGVTNIIPFFGPFIGAIPCALLLLLKSPFQCLIFLIFIVILQQIDGNVIGPKILGNTTGVSSFWVLFSILLFGGLWGVFGMIVGVPLFAVIYDIVRRLVYRGLKSHQEESES